MALTNFIPRVTLVTAEWLNRVDAYVENNSTTLASYLGATLIGWIQALTGAVLRTVASKLEDVVSVFDFMTPAEIGAAKNRTLLVNHTAAMAAAHATGKIIYYPSGTYYFSTFSFDSGGIFGDGPDQTVLQSSDTSSTSAITYLGSNLTTRSIPVLKDFALFGPQSAGVTTKAGGAGLDFNPGTGEVGYFNLRNIRYAYWPICVNFVRAAYWSATNIQCLAYTVAGFKIANEDNADSGDSSIVGSLFNAGNTTGDGILHNSSGGLKITGNKFLGGSHGYSLQFNSNTNTGVLMICGNSFENMTNQDISLTRITGSGNFTNINITGNEFAVGPTGIQTDGNTFLSEINITGNTFNLSSGSGFGVNLATVSNFNIAANTFKGNGGSPTAISIASSCSNGKIGINTYKDITSIANSSTTTTITKDTQTGTSTTSAAGWNPFGSLFSGPSTSVTYSIPYLVAPTSGDIVLIPTSTNGACSALLTGVSETGFTYIPLSSVTGIAAVYSWKAAGIL